MNSGEQRRLETLHSLRLLDTAAEESFDSYTRLAAIICEVPIALISLVDANRQWFKSKVGLAATETPRDIAFCDQAIRQDRLFEVADATADVRFSNNPLVTRDPKIRAYAGMPLITSNGEAIGTLCVIDRVPRMFTPQQREALKILAAQLMQMIELRRESFRLQEFENFERAILNSAGVGIVTTDTEGVISHFSPAAERMLGYAADEVIGKMTTAAFHDVDEIIARAVELSKTQGTQIEPGFEVFVRRARAGTVETREWTWVRKDGSTFPILLSVSAIKQLTGEIEGFLGVARDITEVKKAQQDLSHSEEMLNRAQSLAKVGSWEFDLRTHELTWSREHYRIFELTELPSAQLYAAYRSKIHPDDIAELDRVVQIATEKGTGFIYQHRVMCNDGKIKQVVGIGEVIKDADGKPAILRGTVQDVSHERAVQQQIIEARNAAEAANMAKSEFLSRMSHELRTPLNAIVGFGRLLTDGAKLTANLRNEYLNYINHAGMHLLQLINEILDLSAVESGAIAYNLADFPASQLIGEVIALVKPIVTEKQQRIDARNSVFVLRADFFRLKQVLLNLVSNALKYSEPGSAVSIGCEQVDAGFVRISVTDQGHGIPAEKQSQLFKPFNRLGAAPDLEGTGIGLTIARKLMEHMGGKIGFRNNETAGATFWMDVPAGNSAAASAFTAVKKQAANSGNAQGPARALRILLVEDNPVNVALMEAYFSDYKHYDLDISETGAEAIGKLDKNAYDVALLDINLPDMSGHDILRFMRQSERLKSIPAFALSADAMVDQIEKGLAAGFDQYFTKPIDFGALVSAIDEIALRR